MMPGKVTLIVKITSIYRDLQPCGAYELSAIAKTKSVAPEMDKQNPNQSTHIPSSRFSV